MRHTALYLGTILVWGSTWWVITFQLGIVDPILSVSYRFLLAAVLLLGYCKWNRLNLHFTRQQHTFIALQGLLLYGLNYGLIYHAQRFLTSGLVAVLFSTIVMMNIINNAWFLRKKLEWRSIIGALLGLSGTGLIFLPELRQFSLENSVLWGIIFVLTGTLLASLGNITSARNQLHHIPILQTNAYGMLYGALLLMLIALLTGKPWTFEWSFTYISSLVYLSVFGSIVAFEFYLTLVGQMGADKAVYSLLFVPVVALLISTLFEGYIWTKYAFIGVVLIFIGNLLAVTRAEHWQWVRR